MRTQVPAHCREIGQSLHLWVPALGSYSLLKMSIEGRGIVDVQIKKLSVDMPVKQNGIELEVRSVDGKTHMGDCYATMTGIVWCKGRTTRKNGVKISWENLAVILRTNESARAALDAAKVS
jgi:hypothetical protein